MNINKDNLYQCYYDPNNTKKPKLLLVTFPIDWGNATLEKLLIGSLEQITDLEIFRFAPDPKPSRGYRQLIQQRILGTFQLWRAVKSAQKEGRKVLFQGISPALYALPAIGSNQTCVITDWTRKLYEPFSDILPSPPWLTKLHSQVLNRQQAILGLTHSVADEIQKDYSVPENKIKRVRYPFSSNLKRFKASPKRQDDEIRLLFVGGDLYRKGGDCLLRWMDAQNNSKVKLTMVTKTPLEPIPGVEVVSNLEFGQPAHSQLFESHDVFVLPTTLDAYPAVLGEAACAGLAMLTTENALGAREVIVHERNGYICPTQQALLQRLDKLVQDKALIESMKVQSRQHMEQHFSDQVVSQQLLACLFE